MSDVTHGRWLVIGGAGYIGSHVVHALVADGHRVCVLDDLSTGLAERLAPGTELVLGDARDPSVIMRCLEAFRPDGIVHMAARKQPRESLRNPVEYWTSNLGPMLALVEALSVAPVPNLLFSSSCSIYGDAASVTTATPPAPRSPYARTKLVSEWLLSDCCAAVGTRWASLRYFNVIGNGDFRGAADTSTETLIPSALRAISDGRQPRILGGDHPTADGTCVRDYVDVRDVASAHVFVANGLQRGVLGSPEGCVLNVSNGRPRSVREVLNELAEIAGWTGGFEVLPGSPADPDVVFAVEDARLAGLGWTAEYDLRASLVSTLGNAVRSEGDL